MANAIVNSKRDDIMKDIENYPPGMRTMINVFSAKAADHPHPPLPSVNNSINVGFHCNTGPVDQGRLPPGNILPFHRGFEHEQLHQQNQLGGETSNSAHFENRPAAQPTPQFQHYPQPPRMPYPNPPPMAGYRPLSLPSTVMNQPIMLPQTAMNRPTMQAPMNQPIVQPSHLMNQPMVQHGHPMNQPMVQVCPSFSQYRPDSDASSASCVLHAYGQSR